MEGEPFFLAMRGLWNRFLRGTVSGNKEDTSYISIRKRAAGSFARALFCGFMTGNSGVVDNLGSAGVVGIHNIFAVIFGIYIHFDLVSGRIWGKLQDVLALKAVGHIPVTVIVAAYDEMGMPAIVGNGGVEADLLHCGVQHFPISQKLLALAGGDRHTDQWNQADCGKESSHSQQQGEAESVTGFGCHMAGIVGIDHKGNIHALIHAAVVEAQPDVLISLSVIVVADLYAVADVPAGTPAGFNIDDGTRHFHSDGLEAAAFLHKDDTADEHTDPRQRKYDKEKFQGEGMSVSRMCHRSSPLFRLV